MKILVIGGTGSLGSEFINQHFDKSEITCLSRCELKQKDLKTKFPQIKCVLGDIRNRDSLARAFERERYDHVYLFAALKHVDVLESNVEECVNTNIQGTINVLDMCRKFKVSKLIFSSTDKAVQPINVYGQSKAISEKILLNAWSPHDENGLDVYVFRWANVCGSRGSVIPVFIDLLRAGKSCPITDPRMTRFFITIREAVSFINSTVLSGPFIESFVHIPDLKSAKITDVVGALAEILGVAPKMHTVGIRLGEKLHERIIADHEANGPLQSDDQKCTFSKDELKALLTPLVKESV